MTSGSYALDDILRHIRTLRPSLDEVATATGFSTELHLPFYRLFFVKDRFASCMCFHLQLEIQKLWNLSLIRVYWLNPYVGASREFSFIFLMVEAESPSQTLLLCKKSKATKGKVALCRASVTSVARRRHKGLDLRVIMSCQTVVTFSSSGLR